MIVNAEKVLWRIYNSVKQNDVEVRLRCGFLHRVLWRS